MPPRRGRVRHGAPVRRAARGPQSARRPRRRIHPRGPPRRPGPRDLAHGERSPGAADHGPEPPSAAASERRVRRDVGRLPGSARGQALPPRLPARSARALANRRPIGQRDLGHLPGDRSGRRRDRRAPARHRQARRLRGPRRRDRDVRRRPPPGGDRARLLPSAPGDRAARRLPPRARPGRASHHPQPSWLARARQPGRSLHAGGDARPHDRQPRRPTRQLRSAREGPPGRCAVVGLRQGAGRRRVLRAAGRGRPPSGLTRLVNAPLQLPGKRPQIAFRFGSPGAPLRRSRASRTTVAAGMAKDTEKLIRQLSLISYLMAERRPVTAQEIRRDVEGYSAMNEDAFARRFYADRSELEALRIVLSVEKPVDGLVEQETYSLAPENFHLPPIEFSDRELAALHTALHLLDGEFAYAEPLRIALQQISWGRPSPLGSPEQHTVALGITGAAGGHELSQRLAKIETAIFRRKTIVFDYYTMERGEAGTRKVDPYHLLFQSSGQFYLLGHSHERKRLRGVRVSRIRGKVGYATRAEHDFQRPADFAPRAYANRIDWQFGDPVGTAEVWIAPRIAWQIERHFGRYGEMREGEEDGARVLLTPYANARQLIAWVLGLGENARIIGPPELAAELRERLDLVTRRHTGEAVIAPVSATDGDSELESVH